MSVQAIGQFTRTIAVVLPRWREVPGHDDPEVSHRAFEKVVRILTDTAPSVDVPGPGTALVAARGPSRFFGGENEVMRRIHTGLGAVAATIGAGPVGVGIADGRLAALVIAHRAAHNGEMGECLRVPAGESGRFLARLSTTVLCRHGGVPEETVQILGRLGLRTLAAVGTLDERALIDRFGSEGERLHLLVRGADAEPLIPETVVDVDNQGFSSADWPQGDAMSVHRLLDAAAISCARLHRDLATRGMQCVRLRVTVEFDRAPRVSDRVWHEQSGFTEGSMLDRLRWQLDSPDTDSDVDSHKEDPPSVMTVVFAPVGIEPLVSEHRHLWGGRHDHDARAARAVSSALAVGRSVRIVVPEWTGGRDPLSAYTEVDVAAVDLRDTQSCRQRVTSGRGVARTWTGALPRPLPATVFRSPKSVSLSDHSGCAVIVSGRHELSAMPARLAIGDRVLPVTRWAGPWPLEERWWDPLRRRRCARLQVQTPEAVYVLQIERSQWSLIGRYD